MVCPYRRCGGGGEPRSRCSVGIRVQLGQETGYFFTILLNFLTLSFFTRRRSILPQHPEVLHFSTQAFKDYVDFAQLNCLHLHLFLEFKLEEIIGNLCSTLARENKHLVFANRHGKITAGRRNFTTLFNLKGN